MSSDPILLPPSCMHASAYYKPEPFPLELDELNINAKTKFGLNVKIATQKDTILRRFDKVKNPNLVVLADFQNGKIYVKKDDGSLWLFAHSNKGAVWIKLHGYIMETLELNYRVKTMLFCKIFCKTIVKFTVNSKIMVNTMVNRNSLHGKHLQFFKNL